MLSPSPTMAAGALSLRIPLFISSIPTKNSSHLVQKSPVCDQPSIGWEKSGRILHVTSNSSHGLTKSLNASSR